MYRHNFFAAGAICASVFLPLASATYTGSGICQFDGYSWKSSSTSSSSSNRFAGFFGGGSSNDFFDDFMGDMSSFDGFQSGGKSGSASNCASQCSNGCFGWSFSSSGNCATASKSNTVVPQSGCSVGYKWTCMQNQFMDVNGNCNACPVTHTCSGDGKSCVQCPSGQGVDTLTSSATYGQCACVNGFKSSSGACVTCPVGSALNSAKTGCTCPAGSYWTGSSCSTCTGVVTTVGNTQSCTACPAGATLNSAKTACSCPAGSSPNAAGTYCVCTASGTYFTGSTCASCTGGAVTTAASGAQTCTTCPTGSTFSGGKCNCPAGSAPNSAGTYCVCSGSGSYLSGNTCATCPSGVSTTDASGAQSCTTCPVGATSTGGKCSCPAGSVANPAGTYCVCTGVGTALSGNSCTTCSSGVATTAPSGAQSCSSCPVGAITSGGKCTCPAGSSANAAGTYCVCSGTGQYLSGNTCLTCKGVTTTAASGAQTCSACPQGSTLSADGKECVCPLPSVMGASGNCGCWSYPNYYYTGSTCASCLGKVSADGQSCSKCPSDSYIDMIAGTCKPCSAGSIQSAAGTSCTPTTCPQGSTLTNGKCTCPSGSSMNVAGTACVCSMANNYFSGSGCSTCAGTVSGDGQSCTKCPSTSYMDWSTISCKACNAGGVQAADGTSCTYPTCPKGSTLTNGKCTCPSGSSMNVAGTACLCSMSKYYFTGTGCSPCLTPGSVSADGQSCTNCPSTSYMDYRTVSCQPCLSGGVQAPDGQSCIYPSGVHRRSLTNNRDMCPSGFKACPIGGGLTGLTTQQAVGFECINTDEELTSCGGCASEGTGLDCTAIPHALSTGCAAGRCKVFSCRRGYMVNVTGACERRSNRHRGRLANVGLNHRKQR